MESENFFAAIVNQRWAEQKAWAWYEARPWLVGCNYAPRHAINQLEMWQAETFHPQPIDEELGWLAALGMNTLRVFLHDLLWQQDAKGFLTRMEQFLEIADQHKIGIMFVIFDSCWNPHPHLGKQNEPLPGVHNSYWAQSPGVEIVNDAKAFDQLEDYVTGVVSHFRNDARVLMWDVWNEPDNLNLGEFQKEQLNQKQKGEIVLPLLAKTFQWVRSANPTQPLISGIWAGDWSDDQLLPIQRLQLLASDLTSFHRYTPLEEARATIEPLKRFGRPLICTEYLARGAGNTFQAILPYFKEEKIAAYNWGAVSGKTQTIYPWDSWQKKYASSEPVPWHHDILRPDGSPYDATETALIQSLTDR